MFGFLNVYKPSKMSSHDVVSVLRRVTKVKQIGHTGTLDPLAQGVLPLAIGKATRLIEYLTDDKSYIASLEFGKVSDSYDVDGVVSKFSDKIVTEDAVVQSLKMFSGEIEQIPPVYSAVHYKGERLYELARRGELPSDIPKRKVKIYEIKLLEFDSVRQVAKIFVACSSGTYIRSIVNDLGMMVGAGAVMNGLIRTAAGPFRLEDALHLEQLPSVGDVLANLINPLDVLHFNCYNLSENEYEKIKHGQSLDSHNPDGVFVLTYNSCIAAIAEQSFGKLNVKKVFEV